MWRREVWGSGETEEASGGETRGGIGGDDGVEGIVRGRLVGVHDAGDGLPDLREGDAAVEEGGDGDFISGVEDGGERAAFGAGADGEVEGWEDVAAGGFEVEFSEGGEVEGSEGIGDAVRVGDGVVDGEAHVGAAELGEDRAVGEFDHGVDDALRVDDDIDASHFDIEEPAGLDHFEAFVEERGGVDGDFAAHVPRGVFEGLFEGGGGDLVWGPCAEGPAASGEDETADVGWGSAVEALEDGVVFAVDGEDADPAGACGCHDEAAGHDEDFLGGDGEVAAAVDGGEGGFEACGADDGDEDEVGCGGADEVGEPVFAGEDGGGGRDHAFEGVGGGGVGEAEVAAGEFGGLLGEEVGAGGGGHADDFHAVREVAGDLEGAGADAACGAEDEDPLTGGGRHRGGRNRRQGRSRGESR